MDVHSCSISLAIGYGCSFLLYWFRELLVVWVSEFYWFLCHPVSPQSVVATNEFSTCPSDVRPLANLRLCLIELVHFVDSNLGIH